MSGRHLDSIIGMRSYGNIISLCKFPLRVISVPCLVQKLASFIIFFYSCATPQQRPVWIPVPSSIQRWKGYRWGLTWCVLRLNVTACSSITLAGFFN